MTLDRVGDGLTIHLLTSAAPILLDGKIAGAIQTLRDVTANKAAEQARMESEEKFARFFHSNPGFLFILDVLTDRIIEINNTALETSGLTCQEAIDRTLPELGILHRDTYARLKQAILAAKGARNEETTITIKNGALRQVIYSAWPLLLGDRPCIIVSGFDITESRQAMEALRHSESLLKSLAEANIIGVGSGDSRGRATYINDKMLGMMVRTREDFEAGRFN